MWSVKRTTFKIKISSTYTEWWRYNVSIVAGCFGADGERVGFVANESHIAQVGANLASAPDDYPEERVVELETPECASITLHIYFVPHTLPTTQQIDAATPFEAKCEIYSDGEVVESVTHTVNQWSGLSVREIVGK